MRTSANDESLPILIKNANNAMAPAVGRARNFVRVNPILDVARTVCRRATQASRLTRNCSVNYFNLTAADKFVTAPTKSSVIERFPSSEWVEVA